MGDEFRAKQRCLGFGWNAMDAQEGGDEMIRKVWPVPSPRSFPSFIVSGIDLVEGMANFLCPMCFFGEAM